MKVATLLAACAVLVPVAAQAAPTYLECTMTSGAKGDVVWNVTLDENAGTASYEIPALEVVQKMPAVFTAEKVSFGSIVISRIDLSMVRTTTLLGETKVDRGQCKLIEPPKRKF